MRILHIARVTNNKTTGVNVVVPQHILAEANLGEEVYFYNLASEKIEELQDLTIDIPFEPNLIANIEKRIGKIDAVIIHEVNNIENIKIYKELLELNIPYIILPHGEICNMALKKKWLKKKIAYTLLFNKFIRKAAAIQCLSEQEVADIKIKTPPKFIVGNGVTVPNVIKNEFNNDSVSMIYIGRIDVMHKGLDLMIEAVSKCISLCREKNISLNIYGPDIKGRGDEVRSLIAKFGVGEYVKLNPPIFGEDKERALLGSDLFIQTSRFEGLPVGVLEVMSYGIPCILTHGTNLTEMMNENDAGYYAGDNADSIADAIRTAVSDRDNWKNKGMNARSMVANNYEWGSIARMEINKYRDIVGK